MERQLYEKRKAAGMGILKHGSKKRKTKAFPMFVFVLIVLATILVSAALFMKSFLDVRAGFEGYGGKNAGGEGSVVAVNSVSGAAAEANENTVDWKLVLVNPWNSLPESWQQELVSFKGGELVDGRIYGPLAEMLAAAEKDGVYTRLGSGYRTYENQQEIMDKKIQEYINLGFSRQESEEQAVKWVAVPGTSEHQLGIAVDINGDYARSTREEVYSWLEANSARFGFILRYPADKTDITGISYEPWHFRYVGKQAAEEINALGYCLEEYVEYLGLYDNAGGGMVPAA